VDAFEAALHGRIPDLLEGIFARAGLVSDIELVEEFPSRYDVAVTRQHRWARGDWQLLPWIFGRAQNFNGGQDRTAIPLIGRWKMVDNLRRTLSAPATFFALITGFTLPFACAGLWTGFVLATIAIPALLRVVTGIVPRRLRISQRRHWHAVGADFALALSQIVLLVTLLAHQAWLMTDAITRTLYRLLVSRRRLLEWVAAAQAKFRGPLELRGFYQRMASGVALAVVAAVIVAYATHRSFPILAPFLVLWMLSPVVALWASLPSRIKGDNPASDADT
jgi:cyclic beta-1,2-glucan glucanotransferase